jgi:hypothetical protein
MRLIIPHFGGETIIILQSNVRRIAENKIEGGMAREALEKTRPDQQDPSGNPMPDGVPSRHVQRSIR